MLRLICFISALLLFVNAAHADIRLPSIIGSHMVIQQNSRFELWGWSGPGEQVIIAASWSQRVDTVRASGDAKWSKVIEVPKAGGPYSITLRGQNTIILEDVMIGEVWFCSGQSNMEWSSAQNLPQILEEIPHSNNKQIRLFHVPKLTAETPQEQGQGTWKVSGPEALKGFSAIAYFFAKQLEEKLGVAVGVINSSWGGTPAEVWTPEEAVMASAPLLDAAKALNETSWWPVHPARTYNAMVAPYIKFPIAGVLWYQGESNTSTNATYSQLLEALIRSWRKKWNLDFPFYYVQIAPHTYAKEFEAALLREQQSMTLRVPKTGMVVTTDLVDNVKDIHPKDKKSVALRLAAWALGDHYGKPDAAWRSPSFASMEKEKSKLIIHFNDATEGFVLRNGKMATGFLIAGADSVFVPADVVKLDKGKITVSSRKVKEPLAVRFSFDNTEMSNLAARNGLPVIPFRTDDWPVQMKPVKK